MTLPLTYVAHPVGAADRGGVIANVERALRWYRWLVRAFPDRAFVMPWLAPVLGLDGAQPADRARGTRDGNRVLERCDAIVLVGGRLTPGMAAERELALELGRHVDVIDLLALGDEPPAWNPGWTKGGDHGARAESAQPTARSDRPVEKAPFPPNVKPQTPGTAACPTETGAPREPSPSSSVSSHSAAPASTDATGAARVHHWSGNDIVDLAELGAGGRPDVATVRDLLARAAVELDRRGDRIIELERDNAELSPEVARLAQQAGEAKRDLEAARERITNLKDGLAAGDAALEKRGARIDELGREVHRLKDKLGQERSMVRLQQETITRLTKAARAASESLMRAVAGEEPPPVERAGMAYVNPFCSFCGDDDNLQPTSKDATGRERYICRDCLAQYPGHGAG